MFTITRSFLKRRWSRSCVSGFVKSEAMPRFFVSGLGLYLLEAQVVLVQYLLDAM